MNLPKGTACSTAAMGLQATVNTPTPLCVAQLLD